MLTTVHLTRMSLTKQRSHSQEKAAMTQESVTLGNKLRWSKTCLILHLTRWTVRGVVDKFASFCESVVIIVIFPCVTVSLVVNFLFLDRIHRKPDSAIVLWCVRRNHSGLRHYR